MMGDTGLYKYVYNGEIIYIGMSTKSISSRIKNHALEERFQPYLSECSIQYIPLTNHAEIRGTEKLLINKYKPILNSVDAKSCGMTIDIEKTLPNWKPYIIPKQKRKILKEKKEVITNYSDVLLTEWKNEIEDWFRQYDEIYKWLVKRIKKAKEEDLFVCNDYNGRKDWIPITKKEALRYKEATSEKVVNLDWAKNNKISTDWRGAVLTVIIFEREDKTYLHIPMNYVTGEKNENVLFDERFEYDATYSMQRQLDYTNKQIEKLKMIEQALSNVAKQNLII